MNLLNSSEITIDLKPSRLYFRLLLILYVISLGLIYCSSTYYWIKAILFCLLFWHFIVNFKSKSPNLDLLALGLAQNKWTLLKNEGELQEFEKACILVHNEWFHLVKLMNFTTKKESKLLVFFNDQMSLNQIRMMHLMS